MDVCTLQRLQLVSFNSNYYVSPLWMGETYRGAGSQTPFRTALRDP